MEVTESDVGEGLRWQIRVLFGVVLGFLAVLLIGVASADETPTSGPVEPDVSAPAVVVSAGADTISVGAVTQIAAFSDSGTQFGTGFKLDDGRIGTVAHALVDARGVAIGDPTTAPLVRIQGEDAVPTAISPTHDLAAFIAAADIESMPMATRAAEVGDAVSVGGFGRDSRLHIRSGTIIGRGPGEAYGVAVPDVYAIAVDVAQGWSGGPVNNTEGEVVAVVIGLEQASGVAIAVPIEYLPIP